jgi:hypothetical protein
MYGGGESHYAKSTASVVGTTLHLLAINNLSNTKVRFSKKA